MSFSSYMYKNFSFKINSIFLTPSFKWVEFLLPSTLQLTPFVKLLLEPVKSDKSFSQMELGLHEALVNAVRHGNMSDSTKLLRVRRIVTPRWFVLQIQDEGNGIPSSARVNTLPTELDAESGRGLYLIHQCFDDVRWSRRGNRLQIACRR